MSDALQSLWSKEIEVTDVLTPLTILQFQRDELKKTNEVLQAEIDTRIEGEQVIHCFDLVALLLNIYRHRFLEVNHDTKMVYPVRITSDTLQEKSIKAYSQSI